MTTRYGYNAAGDLATVVYSDGTSGVTNTYDRLGQLASVATSAGTDTYTYAAPSYFVSGLLAGGGLAAAGYDALGRRTNYTYVVNLATLAATNGFDAASRLSSVSFGTNHAGYAYLTNSPLAGTMTFTNGNSLRLTVSNRYDNLNRLTAKDSRTNGASLARFNYAYNAANQRTANTNADSSYWVYQYDNLGQVISGKRYWADGTVVAGQQFEYGFDDIGNRRYARSGGNGAGTALRQEDYTANNLNQYTQRTVPATLDALGTASTNAAVIVNNQLAERKGEYYRGESSFNNASAAVWGAVNTLGYLPGGTNGDVKTNFIAYVFVPKTPEVFGHDTDGNLTNDGRFAYVWDGENRLARVESLTNSSPSNSWIKQLNGYDFRTRRVSKVVSNWTGGTWSNALRLRFVYDGWNLIAEYDGSGTLLRSYTWGNDLSGTLQGAGGVGGLLSMTVHTGPLAGTYFYCYDGNGNVVALLNATTGEVAALYEYGPFGTLLRATGQLAFVNPFRFSTKYHDDEPGWVYYGYRYYNPLTGKWGNRDPIEERGGLNLVTILGNDCIGTIDPLGLREETYKARSDDFKPGEKCRHTLSYDFLPKKDVAASMQPAGVLYVSKASEILADIKKRVPVYDAEGECCRGTCIQSISISAHGAGPGRLKFGDISYDQASISYLRFTGNELPDTIKQLRDEFIQARTVFETIKSKMCNGSKINFVVCGAGKSPNGVELTRQLKAIFGKDVDVVTYEGTCSFIIGKPFSTRYLIRE